MNFAAPNASQRGRFQGAIQILRFNWPAYVTALALIVSASSTGFFLALPLVARLLLAGGSFCALFWLAASLVASHWVYDRSKLYRWEWIGGEMRRPPGNAASIHAGLDESSAALQRLWPEARIAVWDIFKPDAMTEPSILRARRLAPSSARTVPADFAALPAVSGALDGIFLLFAAHEIRFPGDREKFFHELRRVLKPGGEILLVEHARDWWNFAAFGPGVFHFLPRGEWLRLARIADFTVEAEFKITPFVRVFHWRTPA